MLDIKCIPTVGYPLLFRKAKNTNIPLTATMMTAMIFLLFALPFTNAQYGSNDASTTTSASSSTTASASSSTHKVDVGSGGFTFNPDTLTVSPGEKVEFHFFPQNHSVAQASFDNPCHPMNTSGFSSGFVPTTTESVRTSELDGPIVPDSNRKPFLL
jgi:plastocyanin